MISLHSFRKKAGVPLYQILMLECRTLIKIPLLILFYDRYNSPTRKVYHKTIGIKFWQGVQIWQNTGSKLQWPKLWPTDVQQDVARDKGTVVERGYCRASPLVSRLTPQPAHWSPPSQHNSIEFNTAVLQWNLFVKLCLHARVCVCVFKRQWGTEGVNRERTKERIIACACIYHFVHAVAYAGTQWL